MNKRDLTSEEKKISQKQLERHKTNNEKLKKSLEYNKALLEKQQFNRAFDDKWREYLRTQKDEEDNKVFDLLEEEIKNTEETIEQLTIQLKEGVEQKIPSSIN